MEVKPGYKQTEVGVIPEEWDAGRLEEYFSFISYGFTNPMPTVEHGIYLITAADVSDGRIQFNTARHTTEIAYRTLLTPKSKPKKNDILLTKDGSLGRLALAGDEVICINQSVAVIRPNEKVEPVFLKMLLESPSCQKKMLEDAGGSTIKHIYITIVNLMLIAVPKSRAEQRAIAGALSDVDALTGALDSALAKKHDLKQAAMQQLLTGQKRLPGFHGEWEAKRLGDVIKEIGDGATPSTADPLNFGGPIHWVVIDDIRDEIVSTKNTLTERGLQACAAQLWQPGTLILSTGATIGEVGVARVPVATKQGICGLVIDHDKANTEFLKYWFVQNKSLLLSKAQGSSIKEVRAPTLVQFEIWLPEVPEQTAIAEVLSDMDAELAALAKRRDKTRALKQGMMQELLTGRTRLV